jgi:hypothetical protein
MKCQRELCRNKAHYVVSNEHPRKNAQPKLCHWHAKIELRRIETDNVQGLNVYQLHYVHGWVEPYLF